MVEKYILAKKTVSERTDIDNPLYAFLVCSLYGLLCKYKDDDLVIDLFKNTSFFFQPGSLYDILEAFNMRQDVRCSDQELKCSFGTSHPGFSICFNQEGKAYHVDENPILICSSNILHENMLNVFCHEMGHLIKSKKNAFHSYTIDDTAFYVSRTGISYTIISKKLGPFESEQKRKNSILDEVINCFQTTDVMQEILALKEIADDPLILEYVQQLNEDFLKTDHGYEEFCNYLRPLWENDTFREIVENNIVSGDIDAIINHFNEITQDGLFEEMADLIDKVYVLPDGDEYYDMYEEYTDTFHDIMFYYLRRLKKSKNKDN